MRQSSKFQISSSGLHILAMGLMLCDHLWAMLFPAKEWLTCIGRMAFPIFAFMIVEGYLRTHDLRRYLLRMLVWALLSEIPFDLMYGGSIYYPYHQNVLWTFLLSLLLIMFIEKSKLRHQPVIVIFTTVGFVILGFVIGFCDDGRLLWYWCSDRFNVLFISKTKLEMSIVSIPLFIYSKCQNVGWLLLYSSCVRS